MKRTLSGAVIIECSGDRILKLGDGHVGQRINDQRRWLEEHQSNGVIPVERVTQNAYIMPRGSEWSDPVVGRQVFDGIVELLSAYVWVKPPFVFTESPTPFRHKQSALSRATSVAGDVLNALTELCTLVDWTAVPKVLTHGDPTFCNSLWLNDKLVLCDPIPASHHVPDIRAVDLGKLMQSCMGFESIMYGWHMAELASPYWIKELCRDDNEWQAAVYCGVLSIARMLPYLQSQPLIEEFTRVALEMSRL